MELVNGVAPTGTCRAHPTASEAQPFFMLGYTVEVFLKGTSSDVRAAALSASSSTINGDSTPSALPEAPARRTMRFQAFSQMARAAADPTLLTADVVPTSP